jgi:hypothetical protein
VLKEVGANAIARSEAVETYALCTQLRSNLAASLFTSLPDDRQIVVLDMGMAMAATVDLFSQFKSKLLFVDLYSEPFIADIGDDASHSELVLQFRRGLGLEQHMIIDICLFWDFFNYLDGRLLKAFAEALKPNVGRYTRGFGLGVLNARCQLPHSCYGLMSDSSLTQCPRDGEPMPVYPHSQRDLNDFLGYLEIDKSRLMADGRVEYLLAWHDPEEPALQPIF